MEYHNTDLNNLEQLLESLIKMVGKANQHVDSLEERVSQMEWLVREQHLEKRGRGPLQIYTRIPHKSSEEIPLQL